jgi:hypothetical protein
MLSKFPQGPMHGYLLLKTQENKVIAVGDLVQTIKGSTVHSRLVFRFRDGSVDDDTTVFDQREVIHLITDHHIQKGPSFPKPLDAEVDLPAHRVKWRESKPGTEEVKTETMDLPADLANGLMPTVVDNMIGRTDEAVISYLTVSSKPRVVKLRIRTAGDSRFSVGGVGHGARRFDVHVELGGVAGAVAPIVGKQPPDFHVWVIPGEVPTFARLLGPLYEGGPIWITELVSPTWPRGTD